MSSEKKRANAPKELMDLNSQWVIKELEKMLFALDESLQIRSWETMEEVNYNMQVFIKELDQAQLEHPEVQACLKKLQKRLSYFIKVCNEHKSEFQKELQTKYRREQAVFTYRMTDGMQRK